MKSTIAVFVVINVFKYTKCSSESKARELIFQIKIREKKKGQGSI